MSLTNQQYESIIKGYDRTRDYNRHLLEERRAMVYEKLPEYARLEDEVSTINVQKVRLMLEDDNASLVDLEARLRDNVAQRRQLLQQAGLPADYLEPIHSCKDCLDTGYISLANGLKEKCHCFHQQEISLLYEQSNIQNMIARENFSSLSYEYYQGEDLMRFERAVKICRDFVQNFKHDYRNLFFYGTVGTGKSFLSGCIAGELLGQGHSVIYFSSSGLFDTLARYSFDVKAKETLYNFCKDLYNCDLVIIDDLGTEVTNSFVTSQLFACLNERQLRRKSTVISTNLSLEDLRDRYSDRIFSRITSNYTICKLTGPDIRMYKKRITNASNV